VAVRATELRLSMVLRAVVLPMLIRDIAVVKPIVRTAALTGILNRLLTRLVHVANGKPLLLLLDLSVQPLDSQCLSKYFSLLTQKPMFAWRSRLSC